MKHTWIGILTTASLTAFSQQVVPVSSPDDGVMVVAISRDRSVLSGGLGPGVWAGRGTAYSEPIARLTPSGEWSDIPCGVAQESSSEGRKNCRTFAREYLGKPHAYTIVSAEGQGAMIQSTPSTLSECFTYGSTATYAGAAIPNSAIAASSNDPFSDIAPPRLIDKADAVPITKALATLAPKKLDSVQNLRLLTVNLEGQSLVIVQRTYAQRSKSLASGVSGFIFAVGKMEAGRLSLLHWKKNIDDEDERIVGTIRLKSGHDFLITSISDPESQSFRVYGIRNGRLALVYSGGGSAC